jgi:acid phosphatase family membrane protein YuiD
MNSYGGMPSSHSALFAALVIIAGLHEGWNSFAFAISVVMYLVVVRDAAGIRQHLGRHGQMLKDLLMEHAKDHQHNIPHETIVTRLGHTPLQVVIGTICGVLLALLQYSWIN